MENLSEKEKELLKRASEVLGFGVGEEMIISAETYLDQAEIFLSFQLEGLMGTQEFHQWNAENVTQQQSCEDVVERYLDQIELLEKGSVRDE